MKIFEGCAGHQPAMDNRPPSASRDTAHLFAPDAGKSLLQAADNLTLAFLRSAVRQAKRGSQLFNPHQREPEVLLIKSGFVFRSCAVADGRRAIVDTLISGDIVGLDHVVLAGPVDEFVAASRVSYQALPASEMRRLMVADPSLALRVYGLLAEARWRVSRLAVSIGRLDAKARICRLLLDIYDRLRRRELISGLSFNLPMTQEEIGDHLGLTVVHVNRTLRHLREERVVIVDRQVVMIRDLERMRELAQGSALFVETNRNGDQSMCC